MKLRNWVYFALYRPCCKTSKAVSTQVKWQLHDELYDDFEDCIGYFDENSHRETNFVDSIVAEIFDRLRNTD